MYKNGTKLIQYLKRPRKLNKIKKKPTSFLQSNISLASSEFFLQDNHQPIYECNCLRTECRAYMCYQHEEFSIALFASSKR